MILLVFLIPKLSLEPTSSCVDLIHNDAQTIYNIDDSLPLILLFIQIKSYTNYLATKHEEYLLLITE